MPDRSRCSSGLDRRRGGRTADGSRVTVDRREVEAMSGWVDFAYAVAGISVERDYACGLLEALRALAPWLDEEPLAGVHPIRGLTASAGALLVGGRTRLVLRVPQGRIADCERLQGRSLPLPDPLRLGPASRRELLAYPVLHSRLVVTGADDEQSFVADIDDAVAALDLDCETIVGRRGEVQVGQRRLAGFSLMLHGLSAAGSLKAQAHGLGQHRKLGCGLFVPHKSVAAVGA
jgi:CRISPR-associated protein Cas6